MRNPPGDANIRATVDEMLIALERSGFQSLAFPLKLEDRFEAETRKTRSHRMWFEGLVAILGLNACLILDFAIVRDAVWLSIVLRTALVTPVALACNFVVKRNPVRWLREGCVAAAMIAICIMNLAVQGNRTVTSTLFGVICVLIAALFVGVVMRLRFPYVLVSISVMLLAALRFLSYASSLQLSATVVADSLMIVGLGIILIASHSLEREERRNYLLCMQRDIQTSELASANEALQHLSSVDKLTGLPNRRALEERFERMWADSALTGESISAIVVDVDHFKRVNDVYGHLYGDETLRRIGTLLPKALRSKDDLAARFGGEEFVLLLARSDRNVAAIVAERARQLVESAGTPLHGTVNGPQIMWITVSCGVSSCVPADGTQWADLIAAADEALYAAKRGGRNRVEFRDLAPLEAGVNGAAGGRRLETGSVFFCIDDDFDCDGNLSILA